MLKIGIDVGGTFTDLVVAGDGGGPRRFKTPSTPEDPSEGVVAGLGDVAEALGVSLRQLLSEAELIVHGTTVATNTLIERKGAKVALVTTEGFADLLEMREGIKEDRYNLRMSQVEPLVPRYLRIGVPERVRSDGSVHTPLDEDALRRALEELDDEGIEALAVCFLFSYANTGNERRAGEIVRARFPDAFTSLSHEVLPQIKEFNRLSTTVVNSYVGPVLGRYLGRLGDRLAALGHSNDVLVMQSNGGVVPIGDTVRQAVRAILSGPAGGVAGASHYARLVGAERAIGFDMGGTSTDISLIEHGTPHMTGERFESGWKIAVPMIDIHTLGAGGGSIARVDSGGILHVGPDSAGARPGPACYALGGEAPTVTDVNLVLGLLDAQGFLGGRAALEPALAEAALKEHVGRLLGLAVAEAAYGVYQVVTTAMAEGIRLLAARRGVDPRDFSIVAFGGAAGLHVGRVARELQIDTVHVPAAGPVLSAYGMLSTDLRYDLSRSFPASLERVDLEEVRSIVAKLEAEGREKLLEQGVEPERIEASVTADMRYLDQIYEVNVPLPDLSQGSDALLSQWAAGFHRRYEELYSYRQVDGEVRLVTLRVSTVGRLPRIELPARQAGEGASPASKATRRVFLGEWLEVPVHAFERLARGAEIAGPAILESDFTAILVEAGDTATIDPYGGVRLHVGREELSPQSRQEAPEGSADPVTLAVVERRLEAVAQEMVEVMVRTAMSQILNSTRDFSTVILDRDRQMVAQGEGLPVHISALPVAAEAVLEHFGDDIHEGDLFLLNDPYFGGSHLPDITVIWPIFHDGRPLFYSVNRAHHADVGGATHAGYNPAATEIYQEGLRIPPLKLYDRGARRDDVLRLLSANVRQPENFVGDLNAQVGSVKTAARRIQSLIDRYGADGLTRYASGIMNATEMRVRQMVGAWPDGVYKGESFVDDDGFGNEMVPIRATLTVEGDSMTIDLGESSPQVTGFINSAYANTRSLAHTAIMYMAPADVPKNDGSMRPIRVIAPEGLVVNARHPAPVAMSTNHCAEEIVEAIFKAMSAAAPDVVSSGFSRRLRYAITGTDPRTGHRFIWPFFLARGGGGASYGHDGWSNVGEVTAVGGILSPSVELTEERFPLLVMKNDMRPDSAGDGRWRGGLGAVCEIVYEGADEARLNTAGDGTVNPPFGLFGGGPGRPHVYSVISDGVETVLPSKKVGVVVKPGDIIRCLSAGGGGYGDPKERPPEKRAWDLRNGYVTAQDGGDE